MEDSIIEWIAGGSSWLSFAVEKQLLGMNPEPEIALNDPKICLITDRLKDPDVGLPAFKSGKTAYTSTGNAFWDLFFLADIGLNVCDLGLENEIEEILALQREDGTYILQESTKPAYLCISSIVISSLVKMGCGGDPRISRFIDYIIDTQRIDGGWHCARSRAKGQKLQDTDSCPMDNLNILMLLSRYEDYRNDSRFNGAVDLLLEHWRRRAELWRPYGFGIGGDFCKLRYPVVKYGILRVLDVLSMYPYAAKSIEFGEMLDYVLNKSDGGKFFSESVSRSYAEFDFGQTKTPSQWITFMIYRILNRIDR